MTEIIKGKLTDFALSAFGHFLGVIEGKYDTLEFEGHNGTEVLDTLIYDHYRAGALVGEMKGRENGTFGHHGDVIETVMEGNVLVPDIPDFYRDCDDGETRSRIGFSFEVVNGEIIATVTEEVIPEE